MGKLEGIVVISELPPHRGLIANLCFFAVNASDSPTPFEGNPPAEAATDCHKVFEHVELDKELLEATFEHRFSIERSPGYYYVQLRVILFRTRDGKAFAQAEQFFFARRPVYIPTEPEGKVTFPVSWPTAPLEALHHYGTVKPQKKGRWWRFW